MIEPRPQAIPESARAAIAGGTVTRDRLVAAARADGCATNAVVHALSAQALPGDDQLARAWAAIAGTLHLDEHLASPSERALSRAGPRWIERHACLPIDFLPGLVVVGVVPGRMEPAVRAARERFGCDVLPVPLHPRVLDQVLARLQPGHPRPGVGARFRAVAVRRSPLAPLPADGGEAA